MKELELGTPVTFKHGTLSGNGEICGIHLQYIGTKEEPFVFYIVEGYDYPNDDYDYTHLLVQESEIETVK